jgi:hypothetical protein
MATATGPHRLAVREDPAYQAYLILRTGFVVAPSCSASTSSPTC